MTEEFKEKFPSWVYGQGEHTLCLSDDIDSLLSCQLIGKNKNWNIEHFYDFHNIYSTDMNDKRVAIGVDIALTSGRNFDNHVTRLSHNSNINPLSANPNSVYEISRENYTEKYAMSTALLIYSLYDIPLPSTDAGKILLMGVDSSYLGYYSGFRKIQVDWLEKMGLSELIQLQEKYNANDFLEMKKKYKASEKIYLNQDGFLETDIQLEKISELLEIDIVLPDKHFDLLIEFDRDSKKLNPNSRYNNGLVERKFDLFSMALTRKNMIQISTFH